MKLSEIHWEITRKCNLRCKHCLVSSGEPRKNELTTEEVKFALEKFHSAGVKKIHFTGGEPFTRRDLLTILQEAAILNLNIDVITNATMLSKENLSIIKDIVVKLGISLDGANSSTHDFIRSKGSFEKTIKNLELCCEIEIPVQLYVVITKNNIDQIKLLAEIAKKYSCEGIHFNELNVRGRALKFVEELSLSLNESNQLPCLITEATKEVFGETISDPNNKCWIDGSTLFMSADGNLYLCTEIFQDNPNFTIGNILSIDLKNYLLENDKFSLVFKDCCYSIQASRHVTFVKNISPICNFAFQGLLQIKTLEHLYRELDLLYQGIQKYCYNCKDIDCVGYVWLLPEEARKLHGEGIEILEVNNDIYFLNPFIGKQEINIEQFQPVCAWYRERKCVIYNNRPLICRMYPLCFTSEDGIIYLALDLNCHYSRQKLNDTFFLEQVIRTLKRIHKSFLREVVETFCSVDYISKFPKGNTKYLRLISLNKFL